MSLELPKEGKAEKSADQELAQEIVEECLRRNFAFTLAHGIILTMYKETLGELWRKHLGLGLHSGHVCMLFKTCRAFLVPGKACAASRVSSDCAV